jgi:hypothetical protein
LALGSTRRSNKIFCHEKGNRTIRPVLLAGHISQVGNFFKVEAVMIEQRVVTYSKWSLESDVVRPMAIVLAGLATALAAELVLVLLATGGHFVYALEAGYTHLALAQHISHGQYGLFPGEASAPSSSILFPFLLAALSPLGLGALLPLAINVSATLATGAFFVFLARECDIPLARIPAHFLFILTTVIAVVLDLPGLAITGLEHSLHIAMTVAYLIGLVRFVRNRRCDWWWIACIIVQPLIRFEAAGMIVADALIFLAFRKYGYALAMVAIGVVLLSGYAIFLHSVGLPLLPGSVLTRSDWSNAVVVSHSGVLTITAALFKNFYGNLNSFGAPQMLAGVALAIGWLGSPSALSRRPLPQFDQIRLATLWFMTFVTLAQLAGGKIGWVPPRYEGYVLALNLGGLAVIYRDRVSAWCTQMTRRRVAAFSAAILFVFAGYAAQFIFIPSQTRIEYQGPFQLHRFVTNFYGTSVATNQLGYVNFDNSSYVLDLSGIASGDARKARARSSSVQWMDGLLAARNIGLALIDTAHDEKVPSSWIDVAELLPSGQFSGEGSHRFIFFARTPADIAPIVSALDRFAPTLPTAVRLVRVSSAVSDVAIGQPSQVRAR